MTSENDSRSLKPSLSMMSAIAMMGVGALSNTMVIRPVPTYYPPDRNKKFRASAVSVGRTVTSRRIRTDGQRGGMSSPDYKGESGPEHYGKRARRRQRARGREAMHDLP